MAEESSPFDFSRVPGSDTFGALKAQWDDFLEQPGGRTALLQFGINMMQPPSFGDTPMAQVGRALGAAGEATTRQGLIEQREREGEARSEAALLRAEAAQQRIQHAGERGGLQRENLELKRSEGEAGRRLRELMDVRRHYTTYRAQHEKEFKDRMAEWMKMEAASRDILSPGPPPGPKPTQQPPMSLQQFRDYQESGVLPVPGTQSAFTSPGTGAPSASPTLTGRGVPPGAVVDVTTPAELQALPPGTQYRRPGDPPGTVRRKPGASAQPTPAARPPVLQDPMGSE